MDEHMGFFDHVIKEVMQAQEEYILNFMVDHDLTIEELMRDYVLEQIDPSPLSHVMDDDTFSIRYVSRFRLRLMTDEEREML